MQIILLLLIIIIVFIILRAALPFLTALITRYLKTLGFILLILALLYLLATGRLNWLLAAISITVLYLLRLLPVLLVHFPHLQRLWQLLTTNRQSKNEQQGDTYQQSSGKMSTAEAYQILGLQVGAPREDIIAAHRRLIQKNHPDQGGSDYLASKINLAKQTLLKK